MNVNALDLLKGLQASGVPTKVVVALAEDVFEYASNVAERNAERRKWAIRSEIANAIGEPDNLLDYEPKSLPSAGFEAQRFATALKSAKPE